MLHIGSPHLRGLLALTHDTLSPLPFSQVNGYILPIDGMRIHPRCHASRGDQCASNALRGSFGGQLLTDRREVSWGRGDMAGLGNNPVQVFRTGRGVLVIFASLDRF
jgi:hypothetical protein